MRGKVPHITPITQLYGITPAYAGKSSLVDTQESTRLGSPPPMRGKVTVNLDGTPNARITPAYAGKSWSINEIYWSSWDHPRLCGEKR